MKACIITYDEYINIPYVHKYEEILLKNKITYDIILWNRSGQGIEISDGAENNYLFSMQTNASKLSKIIPFIKWRKDVKAILRKDKYDLLILCTTLPGVLISDILVRDYTKRFILDIRDYTYENWSVYRRFAEKNIGAAGLVIISSKGFQRWLPTGYEYMISHNISNSDYAIEEMQSSSGEKLWTIGFVGGIRYYEINKKLIMQMKNHENFKLLYVGKHHPGCDLLEYCMKNNVNNVEFSSRYNNSQKPEIYNQIDLINSIYGADNEETRTLLPHKLYDCVLYKKPIIVSKGTYLEDVVKKYRLGLAVDIDDENVPQSIEEYIYGFNKNEFINGCRKYIVEALNDEEMCTEKIEEYLKNLRIEGIGLNRRQVTSCV